MNTEHAKTFFFLVSFKNKIKQLVGNKLSILYVENNLSLRIIKRPQFAVYETRYS